MGSLLIQSCSACPRAYCVKVWGSRQAIPISCIDISVYGYVWLPDRFNFHLFHSHFISLFFPFSTVDAFKYNYHLRTIVLLHPIMSILQLSWSDCIWLNGQFHGVYSPLQQHPHSLTLHVPLYTLLPQPIVTAFIPAAAISNVYLSTVSMSQTAFTALSLYYSTRSCTLLCHDPT